MSLKEIDALIKKTEYDKALLELKKYGEANPIQFDTVQSRINRIMHRRDDYTKNATALADVISGAEEGEDNSEILEGLAHKLLVNEMDPDDRNLDKIKDVHKLAARAQFKAIQNKTASLVSDGKYLQAADKSLQTFQTFREYFDDHYMDQKIQKDADEWINEVQSYVQLWKEKNFQDRLKTLCDSYIAAVQNGGTSEVTAIYNNLKVEFEKFASYRNSILLSGIKFKKAFADTGNNKDEDYNQFLRYSYETIFGQADSPDSGVLGVLDARWNLYVEGMKESVLKAVSDSSLSFANSENTVNFSPESHVIPESSVLSYISFLCKAGKDVNFLYSLRLDEEKDGKSYEKPFENFDVSLEYLSNKALNAERLIVSIKDVNEIYQQGESYPAPEGYESTEFSKSQYALKMISFADEIEKSGSSISVSSNKGEKWKNDYENLLKNKKDVSSYEHKTSGKAIVDSPIEWKEIASSFDTIDKVAGSYSHDLSAILWKKIASRFDMSGKHFVDVALSEKKVVENLVSGKTDESGGNSGQSDDSSSSEVDGESEESENISRHPSKALDQVRVFNSHLESNKKILVSSRNGINGGNNGKCQEELSSINKEIEELDLLSKEVNGGSLVSEARALIKKAESARNDAEAFIKEARARLKKDDFSGAYESLSEAGLKIREAIESDSDIKFSDGSNVSYEIIGKIEKEISSRAEEVVMNYVMEQKQKANKEIDAGNYEAAVDCLTNAKNRLLQAKLPEDPDLKRLLDFVEKANSMEEGRKLNLYDPLYKEMAGILSDATLSFEDGKKLIVSSQKSKNEELRQKGMEKLVDAGKRVDDLLLVYPLNQEASFLKLQIEQYENPSEFESSFASRVDKAKKEFNKASDNSAATDAYYTLANLAKLKPEDKKLAKFIYDAEIKIGKRRPEVKNTNISTAKKHFDAASKLFASAGKDVSKLNKALSEADESLRLNPVNGDAKLYKDSFALYNKIRKQINVVQPKTLTAEDRASYYKAYDLASERQYARALRIIEPLHSKYPENADINELYEDLKGRV